MASLSDLLVSYKQVEAPTYDSSPELPMDRYDRLQQYINNKETSIKETPTDSTPASTIKWHYDGGTPATTTMATTLPQKIDNKPEAVMQRAVQVANNLYKNGRFTKEQAAAIAGVMIDENNVDPTSYNKAEKAGKGAKGTGGFGYGAGIGSWAFADAKNALLTASGYAANTPIESLSLDDQVKLLITDSNGRMKKYYDALRRTRNIEDASATAILITGGVGRSKNWDTHPTTAEAKALSDWYGRSNDARFGKSPYHWNLDTRRLEYARRVLQRMD